MYKPEQNAIVDENGSLTKIKIEKEMVLGRNGETAIGTEGTDSCFRDNDIIESLTIGGFVEEIKEWTFCNCHNLKRVYIFDGIKRIKTGAFQNCENLELLVLPDTIEEVEDGVFYDDMHGIFVYYRNGGKKTLDELKQNHVMLGSGGTHILQWNALTDGLKKTKDDLYLEAEQYIESLESSNELIGALDEE